MGHDDLNKDIANLKAAMEKRVKRGFMNAVSPGVVALLPNQHYFAGYLEALSDALKAEYEAIVAGVGCSIDCPDLALSRQMLFSDCPTTNSSDRRSNVEVMNHALRDVPSEKVRVHACWGNYEGPTS